MVPHLSRVLYNCGTIGEMINWKSNVKEEYNNDKDLLGE